MPLPPLKTEGTVTKYLLSDTERTVVELLARGAKTAQIADVLHRARATIESHVCHIQAKLGIKSRVLIVRWALRNGLATLDESQDWPQ